MCLPTQPHSGLPNEKQKGNKIKSPASVQHQNIDENSDTELLCASEHFAFLRLIRF